MSIGAIVRSFLLLTVLIVVGTVLLPLRAAAATVAYDVPLRLTATTRIETGRSLRPKRGTAPECGYDAVPVGYGGAADPLNLPERRELAEGATYGAPAARGAAEGACAFASNAANAPDMYFGVRSAMTP